MRNLFIAAFAALVIGMFGLGGVAVAGSCNPELQSCVEQVQRAAGKLYRNMKGGKQLATTPANCPRVDALSHKWAPACRQVKRDCRTITEGEVLTGECAKACALCDIRETFILQWKRYCDSVGYRSKLN